MDRDTGKTEVKPCKNYNKSASHDCIADHPEMCTSIEQHLINQDNGLLESTLEQDEEDMALDDEV